VESLDPPEGKRVLRERMRRVRASIPPSERAALAARAEAHLLSLPEVRSARTVMLFYSFGTEIPTSVLIRRLLERGVRVLLPFLAGEGIEAAEIQPGVALEGAGYGPREPGRRVPVDPGDVDVVVTPGLAFDRAGHRLGYGGGHYDRYLARLDPNTLRVGIGFRSQVVEEGVIPAEPTDERVDVFVTDGGAVTCGPRIS
jgi:5-formyltetrahydrofolate cyclo-ligase